MICPQCGYDMGNKNRCLRCGFEVRTLAVVSDDESYKKDSNGKQDQKQNDDDTIVIDPFNVFLTHPYGYEDEFGSGYGVPMDDPFTTLIDSIFDPIGDLLGGLFGFDMSPPRRRVVEEPPPVKKKKQGPIYVIDDIEIIEPDKEEKETPQNTESQNDETTNTHKNKIKNKFKKNDKKK